MSFKGGATFRILVQMAIVVFLLHSMRHVQGQRTDESLKEVEAPKVVRRNTQIHSSINKFLKKAVIDKKKTNSGGIVKTEPKQQPKPKEGQIPLPCCSLTDSLYACVHRDIFFGLFVQLLFSFLLCATYHLLPSSWMYENRYVHL